MRPAANSNPDMVAAVLAVERAKPALARATERYFERGDETNLAALQQAQAKLDAAREQRAKAWGR